MQQVRVVTDSTADLLPDIAARLGILVVPLNVHFGDEAYLDGVEITSDEFFQRLASARQLPRTSAPSPGSFRKAYESLLPDASGIVCVTVGSKLSSTYNSAVVAAQQLQQAPVRVVDSGSASMALGFAALAAAESAGTGAALDEVERVARETSERAGILFYADTLEYLQKNGRIGRAAGLVGSVLQVKPVLTIADGEAALYQRARTRSKAIQSLVDWAAKRRQAQRMAVIWSTSEDDLNRLLDGLSPLFPRDDIIVTRYGPVIGSHVGPGGLGIIVVDGDGAAR